MNLADEESYRDIPEILRELNTLKVTSSKLDKQMHDMMSLIPLK